MSKAPELLVIREIQIEPIMNCHLTSVRMVIIKKTIKNEYWRSGGREPLRTVGGNINWYSHYKTNMEFLQEIKNGTTIYDPASSLLSVYPMETKSLLQRDICTPMFIAAFFMITKVENQPNCLSIHEWIKKYSI